MHILSRLAEDAAWVFGAIVIYLDHRVFRHHWLSLCDLADTLEDAYEEPA